RALVKGAISKRSAILVLFLLLIVSLILASRLNWLALKISMVALMLTVIYPFVKRYTGMVQLFLGITFALGIPMAFAASNNYVGMHGWVLYCINIIWIVAFDTIYAMLDKNDDLRIGINSSSILLGNFDKQFVFILQCIVYGSLAIFGWNLEFGIWYQAFIFMSIILFIYQYQLMQSGNYMQAFINNNMVGILIFLGFIVADYSKLINYA
ncbi:MAG: UbiA family prenyltransferase, partial [Legionellales bacterium]|nr:UbiA family prenyltransferase [Legionellales bacterium]